MTISCELCADKQVVVQVHNLMGQLMMEETMRTEQTVMDVTHLSTGVYVCTILDNDGFLMAKKKIIITQ